MSDAAYNHTTVAVAALASGVTPYWLLNKALKTVGGILEAKQDDVDEMVKDLLDLKGKIKNIEDSKAKSKKESDLINAAVEKLVAAKGDEKATAKILEELTQKLAEGLGDETKDYKAILEKVKELSAKVKAGFVGKTSQDKEAEKIVKVLITGIMSIMEKKVGKPESAENIKNKDKPAADVDTNKKETGGEKPAG